MKIKYILIIVSFASLINGCSESFLEIPSESSLTSTVYFKTQADFESAVNGLYAPLLTFFNNQSKTNTNSPPNLQIGDMHSDNARYYYNPNYRAVTEGPADFIPDNQTFSTYWNNFYDWIARANQVIALIDNGEIKWTNNAVKDNLKGQALFFRAWSYWWLTQLYGDVCVHLTPVSKLEDAYAPLSPRAEIIEIIIDDATQASSLLYNKATQAAGKVTSGAAKMLLAEVAIWEKDYAKAESLLKGLGNEYSLRPTYAGVFDPANKNNSESIFEINYSGATATYASNFPYGMFPYPMSKQNVTDLTGVSNATALTEGEGYNIPSPDLITIFEPGDARFTYTIRYVRNANDSIVPMCTKYLHNHSLFFQANENMPIWRYSEALLYLAEALNEQGKQGEALPLINQVRNRAGLGNANASSQAELRDLILLERRRELAFEGKRFWDLVRFGKVQEVITAYGAAIRANPTKYYLGKGINPVPTAFTDFRTKFNIPDAERLYNPFIDK